MCYNKKKKYNLHLAMNESKEPCLFLYSFFEQKFKIMGFKSLALFVYSYADNLKPLCN